MRSSSLRPLALLALAALPALARAQGTLSTRGLGYPGGQLSTRSLGTDGALGEIDALSTTNPAAILNFAGTALYVQAEPEYRTLHNGGQSERNTIARYPLTAIAVPFGSTIMASLSVSSLLDRSFETSVRNSQTVGDSVVTSTNRFKSDGAIGDVRLALAWAPASWIHLGLAGHAISGDNHLSATQTFDDSTRYAALVDSQTVTYTGAAYSAGVELTGNYASIAGSYRYGGELSLKHGDTTIRNAHVPDRVAVSAAFTGLRGTAIVVRTAHESWSKTAGLLSATQPVKDTWDSSIGADVLGPRLLGAPVQLRGGARWRTLPYGVAGSGDPDVKEHSFSFGAGRYLGRGRAALDLAAVRATRTSANTPVQETAWTLSVGITVRP